MMETQAIRKTLSVYLVVVSVAVAVQFMLYPFYADDGNSETVTNFATNVWNTLNWFMFIGLLVSVLVALADKRAYQSSGNSDLSQWFTVNLTFYAAVLLLMGFIPNWFAAAGWGNAEYTNPDGTIWHVIDTVMPVLFTTQAVRLWNSAKLKSS